MYIGLNRVSLEIFPLILRYGSLTKEREGDLKLFVRVLPEVVRTCSFDSTFIELRTYFSHWDTIVV